MRADQGGREYGPWLHAHREVLLPGLLAVDLGCGIGHDSLELSDAGLRVIGIDRSLARLSRAAVRAPEVHFVAGDLARGVPLQSQVADVVSASLSLHYFDRSTTDEIVRDVARVLRHDGVLLCRVNVAGESVARWGDGVELEPSFFEVEPGFYKRFFTEQTLEESLSQCFRVEALYRETIAMSSGAEKLTLVARARRVG